MCNKSDDDYESKTIQNLQNLQNLLIIIIIMSWYSYNSNKSLEKLTNNNPKLVQLFCDPDFLSQLKNQNSKLHQYISNHPQLIKQAIQLIVFPPKDTDSPERKFKYPLLSIEMIQVEAVCIMNSLCKESINGKCYLDILFSILQEQNILLLSAAYFYRFNHCLLNSKFKQITEYIYTNPNILKKLLKHSHNINISNVLQLYLNLDNSKVQKINQERRIIKVQLLFSILNKINQQKNQIQSQAIQNLSNILIEIVQKYHLIFDGKYLLDAILASESIELYFKLTQNSNELISLPILNLLVSIINYYSFSYYNKEDKNNPELTKKNLDKLQVQPLVVQLNKHFGELLNIITDSPKITIYIYKILQFLCHSVSLCSNSIFKIIKTTKFLKIILQMMFKYQNNNIIQMLIERTFLCIFVSQQNYYEIYKQYLFCQLDIIDLTISRIINQKYQNMKRKGYFGYLIRIIKIYSRIQVTNQKIINKIKDTSDSWTKVTKNIIKPYQQACFKELGTYVNNYSPTPTQYKVKQASNLSSLKNNVKSQLIQKYSDQEYSQFKKPYNKQFNSHDSMTQGQNNQFFKIPIQQTNIGDKVLHSNRQLSPHPKNFASERRKSPSPYKDYILKKKNQIDQRIKLQKSLSKQKSPKSRDIKNSQPKKQNYWNKEKNIQVRQREKSPTLSQRSQSYSEVLQLKKNRIIQPTKNENMTQKFKIQMIDTIPLQNRRFRKIDSKDMVLLNLVGIYK